jgi:hypothetical protein
MHAFLQGIYADYVSHVAIVDSWYVAFGWVIFGTLGACVAFWHTGTSIPSLSNHAIRKSNCSYTALAVSILFLILLAIPFAAILEAITVKQIAYAGASTVVLLSKPAMLLRQFRG